MRAGLELLPTWVLEVKTAANRQVIATMRERLDEVSRWCRCMGLLGLPGCKLTTTTVATAQKSSTVTARSGGRTVRG